MQHAVVENQLLAGKYRIERVLGEGGMGVVVCAHHLQLDQRVAIKFMLPEALANAEAMARFAREARAAVKIKSEHVARVTDVGVLDTGAPYMVMEYLEGSDLAAWLKQHGPLALEQAVEFTLQAGEAIAEAHTLGIVHRDLKPANLFVIRRPEGTLSVKVLDFGISKLLASSAPDHGMTKTDTIMGSPLYMSPEQMRGTREIDQRSDIWSLGVILYELVTGVPPFEAAAFPALVLKIAQSIPIPLAERRPDLPARFGAVIARCLEKEPAHRFATMAELALALAEFAPRRARASVERISAIFQAADLSSTMLDVPLGGMPEVGTTAAAWGQTRAKRNGSKRVPKTLALLLLGVIASAGYWAFDQRRKSQPVVSAAAVADTAAPLIRPAGALPEVSALTPVPSLPSAPANAGLPAVSSVPAEAHPARAALPKKARSAAAASVVPPPAATSSKPGSARADSVFDER